MRIALDFDGTYAADPELWAKFITSAKLYGHEVVVVTFRSPEMRHQWLVDLAMVVPVVYTSQESKRSFMNARGTPVDIWIDDQPELI